MKDKFDSINTAFAEHQRVLAAASTDCALLGRIAERTLECFRAGGRLLICGNGGSAADAQHIAGELVGRFRRNRRALPAIALTTDTSILTAVTNDLGAELCFARQVEALMSADDVLWILSVSGKSANVLRAAAAARNKRACIIGFTGQSGGELLPLCDLCFCVPHERADRVQEAHQVAYHAICEFIEEAIS